MSAANAYWNLWLEEALRGRIAVWDGCIGEDGRLLLETLRIIRRRRRAGEPAPEKIELIVDCRSGDQTSWDVADELTALAESGVEITAKIHVAASAGLIIAMAAPLRISYRGSGFLWHGSLFKPGHDESNKSDEDRARYMAERTKRDFDWWMEKAITGENYKFWGEEAVEMGVCHKLVPQEELF